ncbi:MAG TPA: hemolysin III family protein [Gemmatimonadales bacterium]|jgi:hemolysin III|nr:hemolysin III family protein [Gemmatimonadales bacterium]
MRIREPVNGASHLVGLLLASAGTVLLLRMANGPWQLAAFSVYGATLILLYATSSLYHILPVSDRPLRALRTLDHIAIYFLIAGTYTPIALITLHSPLGWALLAAVWLIAVAGIPFKLFFLDAPVWISTATYLAMGYLALVAVVPLARAVSIPGLLWLIAGGLAYTIGAVIYSRQRPDPFPGRFGHHEIWHLLVLAGSACHFAFMVYHVA